MHKINSRSRNLLLLGLPVPKNPPRSTPLNMAEFQNPEKCSPYSAWAVCGTFNSSIEFLSDDVTRIF